MQDDLWWNEDTRSHFNEVDCLTLAQVYEDGQVWIIRTGDDPGHIYLDANGALQLLRLLELYKQVFISQIVQNL